MISDVRFITWDRETENYSYISIHLLHVRAQNSSLAGGFCHTFFFLTMSIRRTEAEELAEAAKDQLLGPEATCLYQGLFDQWWFNAF